MASKPKKSVKSAKKLTKNPVKKTAAKTGKRVTAKKSGKAAKKSVAQRSVPASAALSDEQIVELVTKPTTLADGRRLVLLVESGVLKGAQDALKAVAVALQTEGSAQVNAVMEVVNDLAALKKHLDGENPGNGGNPSKQRY